MSDVVHELEEYEYDGYTLLINPAALEAAEQILQDHYEEAEEKGEDRAGGGTLFCGCDTCSNRVAAGFWISFTAQALATGLAAYPPPDPDLDIPVRLPNPTEA